MTSGCACAVDRLHCSQIGRHLASWSVAMLKSLRPSDPCQYCCKCTDDHQRRFAIARRPQGRDLIPRDAPRLFEFTSSAIRHSANKSTQVCVTSLQLDHNSRGSRVTCSRRCASPAAWLLSRALPLGQTDGRTNGLTDMTPF